MRQYVIVVLMCICFFSCEPDTLVKYSYKDITIWRIDKPSRTTFYYNKIGSDKPQIWAEYSGINDGFKGYLIFEESGRVLIISGDGYFQSKNLDSNKFDFKETIFDIPKLGEKTYFIQDAIYYEKVHNKGIDTRIKVIYPK